MFYLHSRFPVNHVCNVSGKLSDLLFFECRKDSFDLLSLEVQVHRHG